jgi:RNA polymerase nonessential primary-like sigma factor
MEIADVRTALVEHAALYSVLMELSLRDRRIMELRFGLDGEGVRTLGGVANLFCVTKGPIRQIEDDVLRRMARQMEVRPSATPAARSDTSRG